jgi:hypothetical protein
MHELPKGYKRNPVMSNESIFKGDYWNNSSKDLAQLPAYRWIRKRILSSNHRIETIVEIGCGNGSKTTEYFSGLNSLVLGIDQKSGIIKAIESYVKNEINCVMSDIEYDDIWAKAIEIQKPGLILCLDVI